MCPTLTVSDQSNKGLTRVKEQLSGPVEENAFTFTPFFCRKHAVSAIFCADDGKKKHTNQQTFGTTFTLITESPLTQPTHAPYWLLA